MGAPKGHPPYPGSGRPLEWTPEAIEEEADALLEWIKKPGNFWLKDFCLERDLPAEYISAFSKKNEKFRKAHKRAFMNQESILFKEGWNNTKNSTLSIFALKCNHKWTEGTDTSGLEEETDTRSTRALDAIKQVVIEHTNSIEQTGDKSCGC